MLNLISKLFSTKPTTTKIIYVVEDDQFYGNLLQSFLKERFSDLKDIRLFKSGEDCLAALDQNPEIIIMDYFLHMEDKQGKNGLETIKEIRKQKPKTQIILLSGQQEIGVIVEAIKKYNCHYIKKNDEAFERVEKFIKTVLNN